MSDDLRQRQQLLKIGTARAGRTPMPLAAPLDALLPPADALEAEPALWLSLGALDLWERSGFVPPAGSAQAAAQVSQQAAPETAPHERLRACPPAAEAVLARLLRGEHPASLQLEWLRLLQRHGGHVPPRFLPRLLDTATRQPALRAQLRPVLGERGRWLARLHAQWTWAATGIETGTDDTNNATWDTGTPEQRIALLQAWRARDPQSARAALATAWPSEAPEQRAALLPALAVGLGLEDEAFLEAALDDRRKEVRVAAQRLLASLSGAQLGQRMLARLQPLLRLNKPWLGKASIELTVPPEYHADMRRDGIGIAAHPGIGEKAGWIVDMLAATDPRVWSLQFERTPRECLDVAESSEFRDALVRGWALGAIRQAQIDASPDAMAWPYALAQWWIDANVVQREAVPGSLFDLIGARFAIDAGGASGALLDAFQAHWLRDGAVIQQLGRVLDKSQDSWTPALTRRFLQLLQTARPTLLSAGHPWYARLVLPAFARLADPATAAATEADWRASVGPHGDWRAPIDNFFDLVRLRHEIILSFQEPA
jgi:hypothetical protein